MVMHDSPGSTDLLPTPEPPGPERRPVRRPRRRKGVVAAIVAAALVFLCANGAMAYLGYRISLDEQVERIEPVR